MNLGICKLIFTTVGTVIQNKQECIQLYLFQVKIRLLTDSRRSDQQEEDCDCETTHLALRQETALHAKHTHLSIPNSLFSSLVLLQRPPINRIKRPA